MKTLRDLMDKYQKIEALFFTKEIREFREMMEQMEVDINKWMNLIECMHGINDNRVAVLHGVLGDREK